MLRKIRFLLLALMVGGSIASQSQVVVRMKLDTVNILVGEQVDLQTFVSVDARQHVRFPEFSPRQEVIPGVEIIRAGSIDTVKINKGARMELLRRYTITSFDSSLYSIPPFEVEVDGKVYKAEEGVGLKVDWMPVDTANVHQFSNPHGLVAEPFVWKDHLFWLSLPMWVVLVLVLVFAVLLTNKKPLVRKKIVKPVTPPYKQACMNLEKLDSSSFAEDAEGSKAFYVALTDILRVYLERRYGIFAMEKTSREILGDISERVALTDKEILTEILETADAAKFAKYRTGDLERKKHVKMAATFLKETVDEAMEHPKPEIQTVVLSDGMQIGYRRFLWGGLCLLSLGGIAYAAFYADKVIYTYL